MLQAGPGMNRNRVVCFYVLKSYNFLETSNLKVHPAPLTTQKGHP